MKKIKIKICKAGSQKLGFVRAIKLSSGMGLKESKDLVDNMCYLPGVEFEFLPSCTIDQFKLNLKDHTDYDIVISDKSRKREIKLLSLGIGGIYDKIEILSSELASNLLRDSLIDYNITNRKSGEDNTDHLHSKYQEFFKKFLTSLCDDQLSDHYETLFETQFNNKIDEILNKLVNE